MSVSSLSPQTSAGDLQLYRHLADYLETVGAGLGFGGGCYLPFLHSYKGTFDVWPCLGKGGGIVSVFISS